MGEKKTLTCQNPSCKKTFTAPLKTLNLQHTPPEQYFSCPHCLTKVEQTDEPLKIELKTEKIALTEEQPKTSQTEPKDKSKNDDKSAPCQYHQGYLSERTGKEGIPDDCLVCKDILDCMLKKMR